MKINFTAVVNFQQLTSSSCLPTKKYYSGPLFNDILVLWQSYGNHKYAVYFPSNLSNFL